MAYIDTSIPQLTNTVLRFSQTESFPVAEAYVGILIGHISHLLSVLVLFDLSTLLFDQTSGSSHIPYIASCLHIVSPAGLFLSAPYGESLFSLLHFLGLSLFVRNILWRDDSSLWKRDVVLILSAIAIAFATTVRSNGLLSGLLYAQQALSTIMNILRGGLTVRLLHTLAITVIAGLIVASGTVVPQFLAYQEYCVHAQSGAAARLWCESTIPSIYNFVQSHYW